MAQVIFRKGKSILIISILQYVPIVKFISPFYYISKALDIHKILYYSIFILFWNIITILISLRLMKTKEI